MAVESANNPGNDLVEALNTIRREAEHLTGKPIWASSCPDGERGWVAIFRCEQEEFLGRGETVLEASRAALQAMSGRELPLEAGR